MKKSVGALKTIKIKYFKANTTYWLAPLQVVKTNQRLDFPEVKLGTSEYNRLSALVYKVIFDGKDITKEFTELVSNPSLGHKGHLNRGANWDEYLKSNKV